MILNDKAGTVEKIILKDRKDFCLPLTRNEWKCCTIKAFLSFLKYALAIKKYRFFAMAQILTSNGKCVVDQTICITAYIQDLFTIMYCNVQYQSITAA